MILGTALFQDGPAERRTLAARLADGRVADLNRIEQARLRKLGEGQPEGLAEVLVPPSLRRLLEGGPRALQRAQQTLAYAEKWNQRRDLPEGLAPAAGSVALLPCLPRPAQLRRADGTHRDRFQVKGPGARILSQLQVTLAVLGGFGAVRGYCLAAEDGETTVLGAWMVLEPPTGVLELRAGKHRRSVALDAWDQLELPPLRSGEVMLLPPSRLKPLPALELGTRLTVSWPVEEMELFLGEKLPHPTLQ
ncbi:MAG: hypothetical protein KGN80_07630 [Acidobacteriota bacterium]|nr:hypothetical protein [Acidobacteriota bacterium]